MPLPTRFELCLGGSALGGRVMAAVALLLMVGCAHFEPAPPAPERQAGPPCRAQAFEDQSFLICAFNPQTDELRIVSTDEKGTRLRGFDGLEESLGADAKQVRFAMNAGMFVSSGAPLGLYIDNSNVRHAINTKSGRGNFYMMPNGVFSLGKDGVPRVETTKSFTDRKAWPAWATQSGPMMVIDDKLNPHFQNDGPSRRVRNGVGVNDQNIALFAISEKPVSFGKFARFFRDVLGCANALYLDGTVSSLWVPAEDRKDAEHRIGPMIVVMDKAPAETAAID